MKLEQQVTGLELSKKLKKAGYKQDGLWWWINYDYPLHFNPKFKYGFNPKEKLGNMGFHLKDTDGINHLKTLPTLTNLIYCVAPTVAELGEALPFAIERYDLLMIKGTFKRNKYILKYILKYIDESKNQSLTDAISADTEANARAKMYLYLKKEGLLK